MLSGRAVERRNADPGRARDDKSPGITSQSSWRLLALRSVKTGKAGVVRCISSASQARLPLTKPYAIPTIGPQG